MKKWILVICPAVMLGVFLVFYTADRKRALEREAEHKAASEAKIAEKKRNDDAIREKNRKEQADKEAKKLADEREKEAKKLADAAKEKQDDVDATNVAKANFQTRNNEIKTIDTQIAAAQKQRDDLLKEILALTTDMAKARIDRTTAELDTDRTRKRLLDLLAVDPEMQMPAPGAMGPVGPGGPGGGGRGRGGPGGPGAGGPGGRG